MSLVILTERSGGRISRWDCATCYARFFTFVQNDKHRGVFALRVNTYIISKLKEKELQQGINIVQMSNDTVVKVFIK